MRNFSAAKRSRLGWLTCSATLTVLVAGCGGGTDLTYVGIPSASATVMTSDSMTVKADGVSFATISIEARDNNQNPVRTGGDIVSLATTRGTLSSPVDDNSGTYRATIRSTQTGPATITGNLNGQRITTGDLVVTFVP
jgi:hypothetical protein